MTTERAIAHAIMCYLRSLPECYAMRVHGDQYTVNQPDIIGCLQGRCFCIEVKRPGKKSRPGQLAAQRRWAKAGAIVIQDAICVGDVRRVLEEHEF